MNPKPIALGLALAVAPAGHAATALLGHESADKSASRFELHLATRDRLIVPIIVETKQSRPDPHTEQIESVTRARRNDGSYFLWQRSTTLTRQLEGGVTATSTELEVGDRQGDRGVVRRVEQTVFKREAGELAQAKVYTRDSSGRLVPDSEISSSSAKTPEGAQKLLRTEQRVDVNGTLVATGQVEATTTEPAKGEKVTTEQIKAVDHMDGRLKVVAEKTTRTRTEGNTTWTEVLIRRPTRTGNAVTERTVSTEVRKPDGSVEREIIEHGRSLFSKSTGADIGEPLVPTRKIVEREVRKPDGTVTIQRDVFRRDVNGEWKKETFSTDTGQIRGAH